MNNRTDEHLLKLLDQGHALAFESIYVRYAQPLYSYAFQRVRASEDCKEIIHDLFVSLWEKRESLKHISSLNAYLYQALRNKIADYVAHKAIRKRYAEHFLFFESAYDNSTIEEIDVADLTALLNKNLECLSPSCQKVFYLSRFEYMPISKIAQQMNLSTGTVENYIAQALKHLRKALGRQ